jgi:hypothetical protein
MFSLTVAAVLALAAPPPKPADKTGRITLWIEDKMVSFLPDGSDVKPVPLPEGITAPFVGSKITASRKYAAYINYKVDGKVDLYNCRLVVIPLEVGRKPYTLEGFVVYGFVPAYNEDKLYFRGCHGEKFDQFKMYEAPTYVLDLKTNSVAAFPLPDHHAIAAVSRDEKTLLTCMQQVDIKNRTLSRKWYLIKDGDKPVEFLPENAEPHQLQFDANGAKILMNLRQYSYIERPPGQPQSEWTTWPRAPSAVASRSRPRPSC